MEDLTKSQIVLLTLFVSFVTSIATGIVTVTLMDQAPPGVVQPINRVVEKTVEKVVPTSANQTIVKEQIVKEQEQLVINAIDENMKSIVELHDAGAASTTPSNGLGVIVSEAGIAVTDARFVTNPEGVRASYDGKEFAVQKLPVASREPFAFVRLTPIASHESATSTQDIANAGVTFHPVSLAEVNAIKLGQTAISLGGPGGETAFIGIISRVNRSSEEENNIAWLETNIEMGTESSGGPLITIDGTLAGINIVNASQRYTVPVGDIRTTLAHIQEVVSSDSEITLDSGIEKLSSVFAAFERDLKNSASSTATTTASNE